MGARLAQQVRDLQGHDQGRGQQHRAVDRRLGLHRFHALQQVRIGVAGQQGDLEEGQAGVPDRGRSAQGRQDQLGDHRLDHEHQRGAEEHRDAEQAEPGLVSRLGRERAGGDGVSHLGLVTLRCGAASVFDPLWLRIRKRVATGFAPLPITPPSESRPSAAAPRPGPWRRWSPGSSIGPRAAKESSGGRRPRHGPPAGRRGSHCRTTGCRLPER